MKPLSRTALVRPALSRTTLCCLLAFGPVVSIEQLAAQDRVAAPAKAVAVDPIEKAAQEAAEFRQRVENRVVEEFHVAAQSKLLLEVEELARVCELDAKSVKKLEIAAKGAAERWVRNEEPKLRNHVRLDDFGNDVEIRVAGKKVPRPGELEEEPVPQSDEKPKPTTEKPPVLQVIGQLFGAAPKPAVQPRVEQPNIANITVAVQRYGLQYRVKHRNGSSSSGFGGGLEELKREVVWTKTVDAVISPAQHEKYAAATEARRQRLRDVSIVYTIGQLDLELRLTEQQHEQLREVFESQVTIGNIDPNSVRYTVERQIKETDPSLLKSILSDAQLKVWEEFAAW